MNDAKKLIKSLSFSFIGLFVVSGVVGCTPAASSPLTTNPSSTREASWFTDPFKLCVQNLTERTIPYRVPGKSGLLGNGAFVCAVSQDGGTFENLKANFKDVREDKAIQFNINNSIARFAWQYSFPSLWDVLTEGPIGSKFYYLTPGSSETVEVNAWNVTTYTRPNLEVVRGDENGYVLDFRIEDK